MKLRSYDKEWLSELCAESHSYAEVLKKAGRKQGGGSQELLKKKIAEYGIDISHFTGQLWNKGKTKEEDSRIASREKYKIEDIFIENSPYNRRVVRDYILRHNLLKYQCALCGNDGEWQGQSLSLQLDHINGINNDNRLENLRWLCPNCHSQTETFSGRNRNKSNITNDDVLNAIEIGATSAADICIMLGLSINGGNINKIKLMAYQLGYIV